MNEPKLNNKQQKNLTINSLESEGVSDTSEANTNERTSSLILNVSPIDEVTGRHQRGFDGEGSEGT